MIANSGSRLGGAYKCQPGRVRFGAARRDDFHGLPILQGCSQGHESPIYFCRHCAVADVRMHSVGEVDGRCALGQRHDVALRREYVNLVREQVDFDALEKLLRCSGLLQLSEIRKPFAGTALRCRIRFFVGLVDPVRCNTGLSHPVHVARANLHLKRQALRSEQCRVQRLVAIDSRDSDVVLETAGHRFVQLVNEAQGLVTGADVVNDDAETIHIDHIGKQPLLLRHLPVNTVEVFLPADYLALDTVFLHRLAKLVRDALDDLFLAAFAFPQRVLENPVTERVQVLETEIFELHLEAVDAETIRDGCIDVERLTCDTLLLCRRHGAECLHVVQSIRQLYENDADVLDHRKHHLAKALGLGFGTATELNLVELADAVDNQRDVLAEFFPDLAERRRRIFYDVVQYGGADGFRVEMHFGQFLGNSDRMRDIGFARFARLPFMRRRAELVGLQNLGDLVGG